MSYENFLIREQNGEADYQQGDTNCSDCGQVICACESLAEWHRERDAVCSDSDGDVRVFPAPSEFPLQLMDRPTSFSAWLEAHGDSLHLPNSFQEWLDQGDDAIRQANRTEAYLDQGHLHT